ncbi:hypothetical protein [Cellulosilyticum sp. I15G10I2]|uniref:hypothetical protein n=1 Tax=Cellulosilyticum sp. I15G10I2 TaxID=1892843 RepID=UPI00149576CB|nr:hypothetical protein [Cellulosilyticum sp. I15G10I2]
MSRQIEDLVEDILTTEDGEISISFKEDQTPEEAQRIKEWLMSLTGNVSDEDE